MRILFRVGSRFLRPPSPISFLRLANTCLIILRRDVFFRVRSRRVDRRGHIDLHHFLGSGETGDTSIMGATIIRSSEKTCLFLPHRFGPQSRIVTKRYFEISTYDHTQQRPLHHDHHHYEINFVTLIVVWQCE